MSIPHLKSGEVVELPLGPAIGSAKTTTLVKTADLEVIRLVIPAGKDIPTHKAPDEITVQCLEGRVALIAIGETRELTAGQLLYLAAGEPHAVKGIENSSLLVTLLLKSKPSQSFGVVQEVSEESFPVSDSPAKTPMIGS